MNTSALQDYFQSFRRNIIGIDTSFSTPFGEEKIVYADWTASGRAYKPIEDRIQNNIMPFLGNTHTETTATGMAMTRAYEKSKQIIKNHVNANDNDVLIFAGSGMTGAINKLQRLMGLRLPERIVDYVKPGYLTETSERENNPPKMQEFLHHCLDLDLRLKPVVFISHMEHHSNQTSWLETIADVEIIPGNSEGNICLSALADLLVQYKDRLHKIVTITGCSNVTGIQTTYHEVAKLAHAHNALCFVDFACSAPYISIDMHPKENGAHLDAIFFSPHKFLGGQGTPGVLIFNKKLYKNFIPDQPGGGTVMFTNPWKFHEYISDIEHREDGGTPPFLQGIKAALAVKLKEKMGAENMLKREEELLEIVFDKLPRVPGVEILEGRTTKRLGVISFILQGTHYNLVVKMLNDRFGIQTRGGCACAGTYGHLLLNLDPQHSHNILEEIHKGHLSCRPGWVRMSIHPVMTNEEIIYIINGIEQVAIHYQEWKNDYRYKEQTNEYEYASFHDALENVVENWYEL